MIRARQWLAQLRDAHPEHHAIAQGMAWVGAFVLIGKSIGAAKEVAIAYRYGVSAEVDAYVFIFNLVNWPVSVWFSVLTIVLVPLAARMRQGVAADLDRFRCELFGLALLLGLAFALLSFVGLPLLLRSAWSGLPLTTVNTATTMSHTLAMLASLGVITSLFSAWMLAAGRHANTLLEGVPALVILLALLAFADGGVAPLVWGTLAGFALHLLCLAVPLVRHGEIRAPRFPRQSPQWIAFWRGFGIMLAGQVLMSFIGIVDQFFAARLDTGSIATLSYANRILSLILGLGATAVARATLPVFSQVQAQTTGQLHLYRVTTQWVLLLFGLGTVTMVSSWWLAPWGVELLFQRGAFTAQNTAAVVEVLRFGLTQLPFYFAGIILVSLLASQGRHRAVATAAGINLFVKLAAMAVLTPILGINGIALSNAVMYATTLLLLGLIVRLAKK
jgi:peptidoglycan biosynthesis protein MviN/MurJ (putative lipid II flippase)